MEIKTSNETNDEFQNPLNRNAPETGMKSFGTMKFVEKTPKKMHNSASIIRGIHIITGTSLTFSNSDLRRPRNIPPTSLIKLASVSADPNTANPNQTIQSLLAIPVPLPKSIIP